MLHEEAGAFFLRHSLQQHCVVAHHDRAEVIERVINDVVES